MITQRSAVLAIVLVTLTALSACASPDRPVEVAEAWLAAYEAGDVAGYQALMDPDATFDCVECGYSRATTGYFAAGGGADQDVRDSRTLALGNGTLSPSCEAAADVVTCATERVSAFGFVDSNGQPTQVDRSIYRFEIDGGRIVHLTLTRQGDNLFDFNAINGYRTWVEEKHPDDYDELFVLSTILIDSDDRFAAHQDLAAEYFASR